MLQGILCGFPSLWIMCFWTLNKTCFVSLIQLVVWWVHILMFVPLTVTWRGQFANRFHSNVQCCMLGQAPAPDRKVRTVQWNAELNILYIYCMLIPWSDSLGFSNVGLCEVIYSQCVTCSCFRSMSLSLKKQPRALVQLLPVHIQMWTGHL